MQPSTPWQQPPPGQPYQDPPLDPTYGNPAPYSDPAAYDGQSYGGYPGQPSAPPYPGQPSAPPYPGPQGPTPQGYGYPQPGPYPPAGAYPQPAGAGQPPVTGRNNWTIALTAGLGTLVVIVIAIVVVTMRPSDPTTPTGAGASSAQSPSTAQGPVDTCLVGKWQQTEYQRRVEYADTEVGKREHLTTITMNGRGKLWTIGADGASTEDDTSTVYTGRTDDGREVTATFSGTTAWTLTTSDHKIEFAGVTSTAVVVISIDGAQKGLLKLQPNTDPVKYTCTGDVLRTTNPADTASFTTYQRMAG